jgi:endonuclease/exonuclease/phosphatase family metal-dependent hydrolase
MARGILAATVLGHRFALALTSPGPGELALLAGAVTQQIARLLAVVTAEVSVPCLLPGDFNEWRGRQGGLGAVAQRFGGGVPHRTFPSRLPLLALDRIRCRPSSVFRRSWVRRQIFGASDHLPVLAEVLPGGARHA